MTTQDERSPEVTRRMMLRGATVGGVALPLLAACGGGDSAGSSDDSSSAADSASSSAADPSSSAADGGGAGLTVAAADVPVGGGTVLAKEKIVVTQPSAGQFKAFDATCTHRGCPVKEVTDGEIVCPCHGSHFSIEDGSPVAGPATKPLAPKTATVEGDQISVS